MKIVERLGAISPERRALLWQIMRYGLTGGVVTAVQATVYWSLATLAGWHPQAANVAGYLVAVGCGYTLHGAFTFRGHGKRDRSSSRAARFIAVSLVSLGLNASWVWLTVGLMGWPTWAPIPAMILVTPPLMFVLNKRWVFR